MERNDRGGWIDFLKKQPQIGERIQIKHKQACEPKDRILIVKKYPYIYYNTAGMSLSDIDGNAVFFSDSFLIDHQWKVEYCECKLFLHEMDFEPSCKFCGKSRLGGRYANLHEIDRIVPGSDECIFDYKIPKPSISPRYYCMTHQSWFCVHKNPIEKLLTPKEQT